MTSRITALLVASAAMASIAAGCGDSDGADDTTATVTTSSISKAQFVKQANSICDNGKASMTAELRNYEEEHGDISKGDAAVAAVKEVLRPSVQFQIEEIRSLGAPAGDAAEIEEFSTALLGAVDEIIRRELTTIEQTQPLLRVAGDQALAYGIDDCAYGY